MKPQYSETIILKNVFLGFLELNEPKASTNGGKPKYSVQIILTPGDENFQKLYTACTELSTKVWGLDEAGVPQYKDLLEAKLIKFPFKYDMYKKSLTSFVAKKKGTKAEGEEKLASYKDKIIVDAKSGKQPQIINPKNLPHWFGTTAALAVYASSYDVENSQGITIGLNSVYLINGRTGAGEQDYSAQLGAEPSDLLTNLAE